MNIIILLLILFFVYMILHCFLNKIIFKESFTNLGDLQGLITTNNTTLIDLNKNFNTLLENTKELKDKLDSNNKQASFHKAGNMHSSVQSLNIKQSKSSCENFETISKSEFSNLQKKHISHVNSSMNIASQISQINSLFDEIKKKL